VRVSEFQRSFTDEKVRLCEIRKRAACAHKSSDDVKGVSASCGEAPGTGQIINEKGAVCVKEEECKLDDGFTLEDIPPNLQRWSVAKDSETRCIWTALQIGRVTSICTAMRLTCRICRHRVSCGATLPKNPSTIEPPSKENLVRRGTFWPEHCEVSFESTHRDERPREVGQNTGSVSRGVACSSRQNSKTSGVVSICVTIWTAFKIGKEN